MSTDINSSQPYSSQKAPSAVNYSESSYWYLAKKYTSKFLNWLGTDDNWKWVFVTLAISGIIHILAVLSMPYMAPKSGWSRLSHLPVNQMQVLPKLEEKAPPLALLAPNTRYAVCRYDVSSGAVSIQSDVPNDLFSIAGYDRLGQNFYILFGSSLRRSKLNVLLVNKRDLEETQATVAEGSEDVVLVEVPENQGVILLRAPILGPAYKNKTEAMLNQASCQVK